MDKTVSIKTKNAKGLNILKPYKLNNFENVN